MKLKDLLKAMQSIEDDRKVSKEIVVEALKEALAKAYRKHIDIPDVLVKVEISEKTQEILVFQQYQVVNEVEDDELEVSLADAKLIDPTVELGGLVDRQVSIANLGRAAAVLAKNVMKQKIREAEKQAIYDEYIDQLDEMVFGSVESVEEKFVVIGLQKTMAIMPRAAQIPQEVYKEGNTVRVLITEVNNQNKGGAQVLVSRADANLVRRLFETEVPEIYDGIVEIKAIARDAGERTKMAVYSSHSDVDAIGACIGPRGARVQAIIDELKGEKIDIFEWSDNIQELIKNALAPAQVLAVLPTGDKRSLLVVVEDNQLSLAIGKKGKNARLAVKLTGMKIDIKTQSAVEEMGIDWRAKLAEYTAELRKEADEKAAMAYIEERVVEVESETFETVVEDTPVVEEEIIEFDTTETETVNEVEDEPVVAETPVVEVVKEVVPDAKEAKQVLQDRERKEYTPRFEKIAANATKQEAPKEFKKRRNVKDDERKLRIKDLKRNDKDYGLKPIYSEEELEEIRKNQELEEANSWIQEDIDFDEYEEYEDFYEED